jgi:Ca2+-transporting ATPase
VCALCNEARIEWRADKGAYVCVGEPTEGALKVLVEKMGAPTPAQNKAIANARARDRAAAAEGACDVYATRERKVALLEFDRSRKSMSVLVAPAAGGAGGNRLLVKGASECVLERCTQAMLADGSRVNLTKAAKEALLRQAAEMADSALRVLSVAIKDGKPLGDLASYTGESHPAHKVLQAPEKYGACMRARSGANLLPSTSHAHSLSAALPSLPFPAADEIESDLVFVGMAGLRDPPRPEVRGAMEECRMAVRAHAPLPSLPAPYSHAQHPRASP